MMMSALLFSAWLSFAGIVEQLPSTISPVWDEAGILSPSFENQLNQELDFFYRQGFGQIQVITLSGSEGGALEDLAIRIVDRLQLGHKDKDDGVLFLIIPSERQMRIEVGTGLEGILPDIIAKRILADHVNPLFREGEYERGVSVGVQLIQNRIKGSDEDKNTVQVSENIPIKLIELAVILIFLFIFNRNRFLRRRRGFGWPSSGGWGAGSWPSGGGGGWSGGGGGFSGGGASDRW